MPKSTAALLHKHADDVADVITGEAKKGSAGPAAPMALLKGEAKKLAKSAKKAAKKDKKAAKKTAELERKLLKAKAKSDRTRPAGGRPPVKKLKPKHAGFSKKRTDLVEQTDVETVADAEGEFDTDPADDNDAKAEADAEAAERIAAAQNNDDSDGGDTDDFDEDSDKGSDDLDDEFEKLLGRSSFGGRERKATSFLKPLPKPAATPGEAGAETDAEGGETEAGETEGGEAEGGETGEAAAATEAAAGDKASIGEQCRHIATWWRVLTPSAGALTVADLKWLGGTLKPEQWADLETVAATEHKALVAKLAEDKFDVTDEGVLMHEVAGQREPLPVDDDGNPITATAADPEVRAKALVEFRDGKLFRVGSGDGERVPVDTADSFSADGGAGWENVTVDKDGKFYLTSQRPGADQTEVVDAADIVMRGQVTVATGFIGTLSNRADPDPVDDSGLRAALTLLQGQGSALQFKIVDIVNDVRSTGREFMKQADESEAAAVVSPGVVSTLTSVAAWRELADEYGAAELGAIIDKRGWTGTGKEMQDENGEPVDPTLARDLLKTELAELEANKAAERDAKPAGKAGKAKSAAAAP